jgi:adenosylhomocysteine nucleosidase
MPEEIGVILENLKSVSSRKFGDFELFSGVFTLNNSKEILISTAWSGWGKVSAARAATRLVSSNFNNNPIDIALFTGVAGAIDNQLKQWDVILANSLMQHDMDARPLFDKYVVPALKKNAIHPNRVLIEKIYPKLKKELTQKSCSKFGSLHKGLIATGDMFISNEKKIKQLSEEIVGLSAVEMEGAAFAQVAFQENIDWLVLRVISDEANENASTDFGEFLNEYKFNSFNLIKCFLNALLI